MTYMRKIKEVANMKDVNVFSSNKKLFWLNLKIKDK